MGLFITFEGIDGSGKSTQARQLAERLRAAGQPVTLTREPGGSQGAEDIRRLLVEGDPGRWSADTEMLLFTAARRDHLERTIRPALDRGDVVICDRFVDSTRAYQGVAGRRATIDDLHQLMIGVEADVTLIFDLEPAVAFARAGGRGGSEDRFERKGLAFQTELRAAYRQIAQDAPARCIVIDADGTEEKIAADVDQHLAPHLAVLAGSQHGG
ncbi:MAG: dTMP kinase [Pseudomonadota bacterium]